MKAAGAFPHLTGVIPATAGTQKAAIQEPWVPACAGMTKKHSDAWFIYLWVMVNAPFQSGFGGDFLYSLQRLIKV